MRNVFRLPISKNFYYERLKLAPGEIDRVGLSSG